MSKDEIMCSVYARRECRPGDAYLVQVWMHPPEQSEEVRRMAAGAGEGAVLCAQTLLSEAMEREARLSLRLRAGGLPVGSIDGAELRWVGRADSASFAVIIPEVDSPTRQAALVTVSRDEVPLASLRFMLSIKDEPGTGAEEPPAAPQQPQRLYRTGYACYASADRAKVLQRVQGISRAGISVFVDSLSLEPGEHWQEQVRRRIDEADVFFLFWSEAAARSDEVNKEVMYALDRRRRDPNRLPEIVPVALSLPVPPPPPELAHLHFDDDFTYLINAEESLEKEPPDGPS